MALNNAEDIYSACATAACHRITKYTDVAGVSKNHMKKMDFMLSEYEKAFGRSYKVARRLHNLDSYSIKKQLEKEREYEHRT